MATRVWTNVKSRYCDKAEHNVSLQVETIYPADFLSHLPPRAGMHRCSMGQYCMRMQRGACFWNGGNPLFDPFEEDEADQSEKG